MLMRKLGQPDEIAIIDLLNLDGTVNDAATAGGPFSRSKANVPLAAK
ncbi:MAG: hypothetical protein U0992_11795 [Planctomycetaceae bacterium]